MVTITDIREKFGHEILDIKKAYGMRGALELRCTRRQRIITLQIQQKPLTLSGDQKSWGETTTKMATSLSKLLTKSKAHSHVCSTSHSLHRQFRLRHFSAVADSSLSTSAALETQTSSPATPQGLPSAILSLPMLQVGIQRIESLFFKFQIRNEGRIGHACCCSCLV